MEPSTNASKQNSNNDFPNTNNTENTNNNIQTSENNNTIKNNTNPQTSSPLLSPSSEYIFYNLFGVEDNIYCLMSLLNSILEGNPFVYDLKLRPTEVKKKN